MNGDEKARSRSRSLSPGRRYDWNTIHFYPDFHRPTDVNHCGERDDVTETVTSLDDCRQDDDDDDVDSDDFRSSDDADEWCHSPSDDDECVKRAHHEDDVRENDGREKRTPDVRKRVKWLDQQKKDSSSDDDDDESQAEEMMNGRGHRREEPKNNNRWSTTTTTTTTRHPLKYETNVDSEESSSSENSSQEEEDEEDEDRPGENSSKDDCSSRRDSNGVCGHHLLFIDESDEEEEDAQQQQPKSSSAAEEISRSTENERREEKKKVEERRYLETHLDDDSWSQVDAVCQAMASSKEAEEQTMTTLKSILRAKQTTPRRSSHQQPQQVVVCAPSSRDRTRVKAARNLEKLENVVDFRPIVENNERLAEERSSSAEQRLQQPQPPDSSSSSSSSSSSTGPTAAEENHLHQAKDRRGLLPPQPPSINSFALAAAAAGDDDAMSRISEQKNRRRFVFDYRQKLIDRKMAADDSSEEEPTDALTLEEFELCLDIHREGNSPDEEEKEPEKKKKQVHQTESGSHIPPETGVTISKPETNISNLTKRRTDDAMTVEDDHREMLWLFDSVQRPRMTTQEDHYALDPDPGPRPGPGLSVGHHSSSTASSRRPRSADAASARTPQSQRIPEENPSFIEWQDACTDRFSPPEYLLQLPSTATRQQYRWSTCIREPEARLLIDDLQPNDVISLSRRDHLPMTSRYPAMYKMKKFPTHRKSPEDESSTAREKKRKEAAAAAAAERSFTVVGQPRSRTPLQLGVESSSSSAAAGYALAAAPHRVLGTIHEGRSQQQQQQQQQQMHSSHGDCSSPSQNNDRKYKYLRERVLTVAPSAAAVDSAPLLPSKTVIGSQSVQNLEDMLTGRRDQQSPWHHPMTSSAHSLPHNLLLSFPFPFPPRPSDQSPTDRRRVLLASDQSMTSSSAGARRNSEPIEAQQTKQWMEAAADEGHRPPPPHLVGGSSFFYGGGGGVAMDTQSLCSDGDYFYRRSVQPPNRIIRPNTQQTKTPRIVKARNQMKALRKERVSSDDDHQRLIKSSEV